MGAVLFAAVALALGAPAFEAEISPVRWDELRHSYRAGCPVAPGQLRTVHVTYWGFDGARHAGSIIVARKVASDVVVVFRRLWTARFPIRRLQPISAYKGSDDASMAADNTSGFNCRFVGGTKSWSMHAYGEATRAGRAFLERSRYQPGMAIGGGVLVRAFASVGWEWGVSFGDYQHFSTTGR